MPQRHWAAVAEAPRAAVSSEAGALRIRTVLLLFGLVLGVGLVAVPVGLFITRPLGLFTAAAARVSARDPCVAPPSPRNRGGREPSPALNNVVSPLPEARKA